MAGSSNLLGNLPVLDGKNWDRWCVQMKVIFGYQEVTDVVMEGFEDLGENPSDAQRAAHKEAKKKDCKALFLLHQCVDSAHFEKISAAKNSKEAWEILVACYTGGTRVKKVKLQTLRRQYELMSMDPQESISAYLTRVQTITNLMKGYGDTRGVKAG